MKNLENIIQKVKNNNINPWDLEGVFRLRRIKEKDFPFLTQEELEILKNNLLTNFKNTIFKIYYNNNIPILPDYIRKILNTVNKELFIAGWIIVQDWINDLDIFEFDKDIINFIHVYNKEKEVYGYLLALELEKI